jgi:DNA-binding PadR family transcriptional regulator
MASFPRNPKQPDFPAMTPLKGGPRGLLLYYVLHSISVKPMHGYEILQDIDSKTHGAWRPGVGSVYPVLKTLLSRGYLKVEEPGDSETKRVYSITEKGQDMIKRHGDVFAGSLQRWMAMRRLYFDMLDPAGLSAMIVEGSKRQFEITKELLESKRDAMQGSDVEFMLREYSLNLERQLDWTQGQLKAIRAKPVEPRLGRS